MSDEHTIRSDSYDTEIEYLGRNANTKAYIDTGISLYQSGKWIVDIKSSSTTGMERFLGGAASSSSTDFWNMLAFGNTGTAMYPYTYGGYNWQDANVVTVNTTNRNILLYEFEPGNQKLYVNGILHKQSSKTSAAITSTKNIFLFMANESGSLTYNKRTILIYGVKLFNENTLVRDFIPVRVGQVGYMYDRVSRKLFGNKGTGSFILGKDIVWTKTLNTRIKNKYDTEENWTTLNPVLLSGESIYSVTDGKLKSKVGDGQTTYNNLPFINDMDEAMIVRTWED